LLNWPSDGFIDKSWNFNTTGQVCTLPDGCVDALSSSSTYTIAALVNINSVATSPQFFFNQGRGVTGATPAFGLGAQNTNGGRFTLFGRHNSIDFTLNGGKIQFGKWQLVVGTLNNGAMSLYVDGVLTAQAYGKGPAISFTSVAQLPSIGARDQAGSARCGGRIAWVAVCKDALTYSQIQALSRPGKRILGNKFPSGGGTTYNDTVAESTASADATATVLTALSAFTESATAADVIDAALSLQAALAESAASSDDLSSTATLAVVLSEILSALDAATTGSVFSDTIAESAAAEATKSALMAMVAAITESSSAADSHAVALTAVNALLEASAASESLSATQTLAAALAESLAAIFAVTTGSIYSDTLDESAAADATKSALMGMASALSEASTAADAHATTLASVNAILESLAAGDDQTSAQTMAATLAESLASLFAVTEGNVFGESLTESAGLAEALAASILSNVSFTESATTADSQSVTAILADVINEAILAGSSQAAQAVFADALTETLLALAVESAAVVGEIISPASVLTNRVKAVLTASQKVHDLLGLTLGALGNSARPRIFTGQARTFLCGRNRGRLPFFEIHVSGQAFDHESYGAGAITQTAQLTIHLGGKDPGAAGLLAERVLLASMAAIRNGSDNLLALGDETLGDLEQGPWGHRRTITFAVTQTYDRTTYEVP
jgi:hypothetical protein